MYRKILVTLDGTPRSEAVLTPAGDIARGSGAEVVLLRIVPAKRESGERGAFGRNPAASDDAALFEGQARAYVERLARGLGERGVLARGIVLAGPPAQKIVEAAQSEGVDLIAMSTRARAGLNKLMFGSVAEKVLHDTTIPILLVRCVPA